MPATKTPGIPPPTTIALNTDDHHETRLDHPTSNGHGEAATEQFHTSITLIPVDAMRTTPPLFSARPIREYLDVAHDGLRKEIDTLAPAQITGAEENDLANYLIERYNVTTPTLNEDGITVDQRDTKIDISNDPLRMAYHLHPGKPTFIDGTIYTYHVPFTGNSDVFGLRPSYYSSNFPTATLDGDELVFAYEDTRHDAAAIAAAFANDLAETKKLLGWADNDIRAHNGNVATSARARLAERRAKLIKDQAVAQQLGYPLRRRANAPATYQVPLVRKKIPLPPQARGPLEPQPITNETYEEILRIIGSMVLVMERSPTTFKDADEHFLRTLFLVTLNAQFDGAATGETFNYQGKTDILIRHQNKNLFIAECKFWKGPAGLTETVDQLLGYAQWRDTKTAILVFSRNKDFTSVLAQIPETVKAHPNVVQQYNCPHENSYRFTMKQKHDAARHLTMTIMAFNIPT